jgi:hypothetical protein
MSFDTTSNCLIAALTERLQTTWIGSLRIGVFGRPPDTGLAKGPRGYLPAPRRGAFTKSGVWRDIAVRCRLGNRKEKITH